MIRIGTRQSELAIWQAQQVKSLLEKQGLSAKLIFINSTGDIDLKSPLHKMGGTGIFTRNLDIALLRGQIDLAVHSLKDVPTRLPEGIIQCCILPRGDAKDCLVWNPKLNESPDNEDLTVATGSIRRRAQWLRKYPNHNLENLRGNVNTRLAKLAASNWNAAIFAKAGLKRINLLPTNAVDLEWMLSAPGQGAVQVVCAKENEVLYNTCYAFNCRETEICVFIEREFLNILEGGCSAPIGAYAYIENEMVNFEGVLTSLNGEDEFRIIKRVPVNDFNNLGALAAKSILADGGDALMKQLNVTKK